MYAMSKIDATGFCTVSKESFLIFSKNVSDSTVWLRYHVRANLERNAS